jgi:ketosteroid isomerase-like protein
MIETTPTQDRSESTVTPDANKALIRRVFEEIIPAGDTAAMREVMDPDFLDHDPLPGQPPGGAGGEYVVSTMHTAQPDLRFTIDDLLAEGDRVVIRWTLHGTNTGPMLGRPPTGQPVAFAAIVIFRIADGRLAERWAGWKPGFAPGRP